VIPFQEKRKKSFRIASSAAEPCLEKNVHTFRGLGDWAVFLGIFDLLKKFCLVDSRHVGFCLQIDPTMRKALISKWTLSTNRSCYEEMAMHKLRIILSATRIAWYAFLRIVEGNQGV
jgi:hypothetical protein